VAWPKPLTRWADRAANPRSPTPQAHKIGTDRCYPGGAATSRIILTASWSSETRAHGALHCSWSELLRCRLLPPAPSAQTMALPCIFLRSIGFPYPIVEAIAEVSESSSRCRTTQWRRDEEQEDAHHAAAPPRRARVSPRRRRRGRALMEATTRPRSSQRHPRTYAYAGVRR